MEDTSKLVSVSTFSLWGVTAASFVLEMYLDRGVQVAETVVDIRLLTLFSLDEVF